MNTKIKSVTIRIERSDCNITNYVYKNCKNADIERLKIDGKTTTHKITFNSDIDYKTLNDLKEMSIETVKTGKNVLWAKSSCCSACNILGSSNVIIVNSKSINDHIIVYKLLIPNNYELKNLENKLDDAGLKYSMDEIPDENIELTEHEKEILLKLYENGYFDTDRKTSLTEIAKSIDISTAALSETLRTSLKKIVKYYIENKF